MRRSEYGITGLDCGDLSSETSPGNSLVTQPLLACVGELASRHSLAGFCATFISSLHVQVGSTALHLGISCLVCQCESPPSTPLL